MENELDYNTKTVFKEDGTELTIDILLGFDVPEYNKHYVAYTINDDGEAEYVDVLLAEYDGEYNIKSIPFDEREEVVAAYQEAKRLAKQDN
jgi:uncharacterized protein YrzB (UPF0473 family)